MEESDQISELPDNILQRILSLLPIKDKIRTSVLSKRWLHLWPSNPMLNFGHCIIDLFNDDDVAAAALDRCLHSFTANLQIMHLRLNIDYLDGSHVTRLDRWIHRADERFLCVLELHFSDFYDRFDEELPISLSSCRWLSELLLSGCVFRPPSSVPLNFCSKLRSLKLQHVRITNEILASVLQACTFLESLILSCPYGLTQLEISNQNLQLKWLVVNDLVSSCRVVIADAPNLQFILYSGNLLNLSFMKKAPSLVQATVILRCHTSFPFGSDCREYFLKISHLETLALNVSFLCTGRRKVIPQTFSVHVPFMIKRWFAYVQKLETIAYVYLHFGAG